MIQIKTIVAAATTAVAVVKTVQEMRSTHRYEASKRAAIQLNKEFDLQAMKKAQSVVTARLLTGTYYKTPSDAIRDMNPEIDRQKTIIRQATSL